MTTLFACAPGLQQTLGKEPSSKSTNLALVEKVAKEFADKVGKTHTIYRSSLGLWHSYKVIYPSPEAVQAHKELNRQKNDSRPDRAKSISQPQGDNPFNALTMEHRCELEAYLLKRLMPEAMNLLDTDEEPSNWIARRIPQIVHGK